MIKTIDSDCGRIISYVELSPKFISSINVVMLKSLELQALINEANKMLPENAYFQLYGKGDCVIVREVKKEDSEPHFFD